MTHYFDDTPLAPFPITVRVRGETYEFTSSAGMFSKDALDNGTKLLLESAHIPEKGSVLDLGCGIGVVGVLVKLWFPGVHVTQSDVTDKAVTLTQQNARRHKASTTVVNSDVYANIPDSFNAILTNPPRAAGKDVIRKMIEEAPAHLKDGGTLQLVALTNKGGKSYMKMMEEAFGNVEIIGRGSGFQVYKSVK